MLTKTILGKDYIFDHRKDQILRHGVAVPYFQSPEEDKVVLSPYIVWSSRIQKPIVVPVWMCTDGASSPLRTVFPKFGRSEYPAYVHDFLYCLYGLRSTLQEEFTLTRKECDLIFKDFCKLLQIGLIRRNLAYAAVRAGGWYSYERTSPLFIPKECRQWYVDHYEDLSIDLGDGAYIVP